ncbi:MAG TPA: hypothetical protein VFT84_02645, partial [Gemmatimonadales bacterium]|nr:hypothetical protein [Gemmatimonadales bacterium]
MRRRFSTLGVVSALTGRGLLAACLPVLACGPGRVQRTVTPPSEASTLDKHSPWLKAHLRTGYVYLLDAWAVDSAGTVVSGRGSLLTP